MRVYPPPGEQNSLPMAGCRSIQFFSIFSAFWSGFNSFADHILEHDVERHRVAAAFVREEKLTVTFKHALIIGDMMFIVIPVKGHVKLIELEVVTVFSISLRLFHLADHSVIHGVDLLLVLGS
jgi:hypothetical protein